MEYKTRQDLLDENDELREALGVIFDELQKDDPDLEVLEGTASEALGLEEEDEEEEED
jgi:hypothetical protein